MKWVRVKHLAGSKTLRHATVRALANMEDETEPKLVCHSAKPERWKFAEIDIGPLCGILRATHELGHVLQAESGSIKTQESDFSKRTCQANPSSRPNPYRRTPF